MWVVLSVALVIIYIVFNNKVSYLEKEVTELKQKLARTNSALRRLEATQKQTPITEHTPPSLPTPIADIEQIYEETASSSDTFINTQTVNRQTDVDTLTVQTNMVGESLDTGGVPKDPLLNRNPAENTLPDNRIDDGFDDSSHDSFDYLANNNFASTVDNTVSTSTHPPAKSAINTQRVKDNLAEPDEHSIPVVTSILHSFKNWFFGGNLVVRVGTIVLLVGVVLLLRLLSDYFETPIEIKLLAVGIIGLMVAGLGLKLVNKRFTYGITLQGAGLSAAYLTAFFAYQVYHVIPSLPSFVLLGALSAVTIFLALRQNAFPLALLAFSGAFLAPLLTSDNDGSLTLLFGYYLLLNIAIAIIAHYRTWKVLNMMGATITFGLAYYWGFEGLVEAQVKQQRVSLTVITGLHWLLYLFIAIRYAQQVIAYNQQQTFDDKAGESHKYDDIDPISPIDTGLMFVTPLLAMGLFNALLGDSNNALTLTSAVMAAVYLAASFIFIKNNQQGRHTLIIEGMLALGFGFTALTIALAFDANWTACCWSIQGLALVWFGRRVLRGWTVLFGLVLQVLAIMQLFSLYYFGYLPNNIALFVSAIAWLGAMFILRAVNNPLIHKVSQGGIADAPKLRRPLTKKWTFNIVWQAPSLVIFLTFCGAFWALFTNIYIVFDMFESTINNTANVLAFIILLNLTLYWLLERWQAWREVSLVSHAGLCLFYMVLLWVLPSWDGFDYFSKTPLSWPTYLISIIGGLILAQLWIKRWQATKSITVSFHSTLWLIVIVILIGQFAYYILPESDDVMAALFPALALMTLVLLATKNKLSTPPWFDWHTALIGSSYLFLTFLLGWAIVANWFHDGVVWGLPYIPILNLFDITTLAILGYILSLYTFSISPAYRASHLLKSPLTQDTDPKHAHSTLLLKAAGITSVWVVSSILIRTLHTYANTPLWIDGALLNDKVQICLTIFWSVILLLVAYKLPQWLSRKRQNLASSFNWQKAFIVSSTLFIPLMFTWIVLSNWTQDGVVWGLPYIPVLNLYDIAILLALAYGFKTQQVTADYLTRQPDDYTGIYEIGIYESILLKAIGIISFWVLSSMLVRALHVYVGTPLWSDGAWGSDKVQTGLTILWTLTALIATFMSSRNGKRFWWFMGISLLGLVVLKLVLVDLSQTDAIWRVVSFIGAGSLILLIGYLAPLPPDADKPDEAVIDDAVIGDTVIDKDVIKEDADKNNKDT